MDVVDHSSTHFRQRNILADTSPSRGGVGGYHSDPTPDATHTDPIRSDPFRRREQAGERHSDRYSHSNQIRFRFLHNRRGAADGCG